MKITPSSASRLRLGRIRCNKVLFCQHHCSILILIVLRPTNFVPKIAKNSRKIEKKASGPFFVFTSVVYNSISNDSSYYIGYKNKEVSLLARHEVHCARRFTNSF